jgi:hypothetical protein
MPDTPTAATPVVSLSLVGRTRPMVGMYDAPRSDSTVLPDAIGKFTGSALCASYFTVGLSAVRTGASPPQATAPVRFSLGANPG